MKDTVGAIAPPLPVTPELVVKAENMAQKVTTKWNTKNLGLRLGADAVGASCAGALIAPIITIIDRYVAIRVPQLLHYAPID